MDRRYGQLIAEVATGELGKVSDKEIVYENGKATQERFGWENLKKYYEVAGGMTEAQWKTKGMFQGEEITYLDGVKLKNKRVPQRNSDGAGGVTWTGMQWCGIFATYCWMKAGVPGVSWGFPGVKGKNVGLVPDYKNPKNNDLTLKDVGIGDIAVLKDENPNNRLVHHCIVTDLTGESFECVNGNSDFQGILKKNLPRTRINYFYTYQDPFLDQLYKMYGKKP